MIRRASLGSPRCLRSLHEAQQSPKLDRRCRGPGNRPAISGCHAEGAGTIPPPQYEYGYAPDYYDGYVVYYDNTGRPYYYVNGATQFIPETSPLYLGLVAHWHAFGPHYHDWHVHAGDRYRTYRFHGHRR